MPARENPVALSRRTTRAIVSSVRYIIYTPVHPVHHRPSTSLPTPRRRLGSYIAKALGSYIQIHIYIYTRYYIYTRIQGAAVRRLTSFDGL